MRKTSEKQTIRIHCCFLFAWLSVCCCAHPINAAGLEGDKQLLEIAAAKYRENLDKLRSWKGTANYAWRSQDVAERRGDYRGEVRIQFAYDVQNRSEWYQIEMTKDVVVDDGKEEPRIRLMNNNVLRTNGTWYDVTYFPPGDIRQAFARRKRHHSPGWHYSGFDPVFHMKDSGPLDRHWLMIAEHHDDDGLTGSSVTKDGSKVTYVRTMPEESLHAEQIIALDQGGNLIRVVRRQMISETDENVAETTWTWQNVNDVWVPLKVTRDLTQGVEGAMKSHIEIDFEDSEVNEPLADDQFTLVKLGLRQGDRLIDTRTHITTTIKGDEFPPGPPRTRPVPMPQRREAQPQPPQ
jgi:hypothetical protein